MHVHAYPTNQNALYYIQMLAKRAFTHCCCLCLDVLCSVTHVNGLLFTSRHWTTNCKCSSWSIFKRWDVIYYTHAPTHAMAIVTSYYHHHITLTSAIIFIR